TIATVLSAERRWFAVVRSTFTCSMRSPPRPGESRKCRRERAECLLLDPVVAGTQRRIFLLCMRTPLAFGRLHLARLLFAAWCRFARRLFPLAFLHEIARRVVVLLCTRVAAFPFDPVVLLLVLASVCHDRHPLC